MVYTFMNLPSRLSSSHICEVDSVLFSHLLYSCVDLHPPTVSILLHLYAPVQVMSCIVCSALSVSLRVHTNRQYLSTIADIPTLPTHFLHTNSSSLATTHDPTDPLCYIL